MSDEYCQGGFSNETVNTLRTIRIHRDFRAGRSWNQEGKINACRIREVSAVCAYGLHRSAIRGVVPLVRGFAWPFAVWLIIVRFHEIQRCVLRTGTSNVLLKIARNGKSPVPRSIRSTGLKLIWRCQSEWSCSQCLTFAAIPFPGFQTVEFSSSRLQSRRSIPRGFSLSVSSWLVAPFCP